MNSTKLTIALACFALIQHNMRLAADEPKHTLSPREQRLVGTWQPEPGQGAVAFNELVFCADGTGKATLYDKITEVFEWDLVDYKLNLVRGDDMDMRTVPVRAVTRRFLVIHERPTYYRKESSDGETGSSDDTRATVGDEQQVGRAPGMSFGIANTFSGKLSEEQERLVPKLYARRFMLNPCDRSPRPNLQKHSSTRRRWRKRHATVNDTLP